jgi:phosphate starvation-inducible protein PhoH
VAEPSPVPPTLQFANPTHFRTLLGNHDEHVRLLERELGVRIEVGEGTLAVTGDPIEAELARLALDQLYGLIEQGYPIYGSDVEYALRILSSDHSARLRDIFLDTVFISATRHTITPKSVAQKAYIDAIRNYDIVFGIGPAGTGKCVAGSTLVLTGDGLIPIASLAQGTSPGEHRPIDLRVAGLQGPEPASHVYNGGRSRVLRVTTRLGLRIETTPEHPLLCLRSGGFMEWQRAEDLRPGDFVAVQRGQNMFGDETRIAFEYRPNGPYDRAKPIAVDRLDEQLAYLLGVLTGDGCLTFRNRVILSSADPEIVERFRAFADRLGLTVFPNGGDRPYDYIIASAQLYQLLIALGMSTGKAAEKRIPAAVLRAPRAIVRAYLQGLFDSDGTTDRRAGYPSFCSASRRLVDEVQTILLNFGILSARRTRRVEYRGTVKEYHDLEMRGAEAERFHAEVGFGLARKQSRHAPKVRNTNIDVVPHAAALIDVAARAQVLSRADHRRIYDYRINRRWPSYPKLGEILGIVAMAAAGEAYRRLQELYDQHLFWAEVVEITESEADVYDLTVPGTHSFCANGFVNHNTYLAMAMAVAELMKNSFSRIVLCRPAVEAGEKLGFLPGDLAEKVNPYLRPLYDALNDMVDFDRARKLIERGTIEVAPLAFMRGRTLNDSFVILDEAQNTTSEQMKMFLTRLGYGSKAVVTGDVTQIDLPVGKQSGLKEAQVLLRGIEGIRFVTFTERDVVRHPLVQEIITAYDRSDR